jgi:hypothetical protein
MIVVCVVVLCWNRDYFGGKIALGRNPLPEKGVILFHIVRNSGG